MLILLCAFTVNSESDRLETAYRIQSDKDMHLFLETWKKTSAQFRLKNERNLSRSEQKIDQLLTVLMTRYKRASFALNVIPDSIPVTLYRKWVKYPQSMIKYPSCLFSPWKDSGSVYLFHNYDSAIVAFLDSGYTETLSYLKENGATPGRMAFLNKYFPVTVDKQATFNDSYYAEMELWRKKLKYNSRFGWIIESQPFVENIFMKDNFKEAYIFLNRFSATKCIYCRFRKKGWSIEEPD